MSLEVGEVLLVVMQRAWGWGCVGRRSQRDSGAVLLRPGPEKCSREAPEAGKGQLWDVSGAEAAAGAGPGPGKYLSPRSSCPSLHTGGERTLAVSFLLSEASASRGTCPSLLPSSGRRAGLYPGNDLSPGALSKNSSVTELGPSQGPRLLSLHEASDALREGCGAGLAAE